VRALSWNLFHGRDLPVEVDYKRSLHAEFAALLARFDWDVALLQEAPPWWAAPLGDAAGAVARVRLTSRNWLPPLQRAVSERNPDLLKAGGGGCNAILVRGHEVLEHRELRLRQLPEGRWVHGVRLRDAGWVVNVHCQNRPELAARSDTARAAATALGWAAGAPLVFGGDVNLRRPVVDGLVHVAGNHVDHVFAHGRAAAGRGEVLDRGTLSDHPPVAVTLA
jgi:endonuclease/exonuclease/phosphatase family metal-dependent hydrolase